MSRLITYKDQTKTAASWGKVYGLHPDTIKSRLDQGWTVEKALTTPVKTTKSNEHKRRCAQCRFSARFSGNLGPVYCDYLCKQWDETGKPKARMLICSAEDCTVFEPMRRKQVRREWRLPSK